MILLLKIVVESRGHVGVATLASNGRGETLIEAHGGAEALPSKCRGETMIVIFAIRPSTIGLNSILDAFGNFVFDTKKAMPPALLHGRS